MGMYNNAPCDNAAVVTPSDTTALPQIQQIFVGGAGNVAVTTVGGQVLTFTGVLAGTVLPVRCTKIMATNTTATNMVAMW